MLVETPAVVLRTQRFGETSLIATLYTALYGKCSVLVKGARRQGSERAAALELFCHSRVSFYYTPRKELYLLRTAELVSFPKLVRSSVERLAAASLVAEAVLLTQEPGESNPPLFGLLLQALQRLEEEHSRPEAVAIGFLLRLTAVLGFALPVEEMTRGGNTQHAALPHGIVLAEEDAALLGELAAGRELPIEWRQARRLAGFFAAYLGHHLGRALTFRSVQLWEPLESAPAR